MFNKQFLYDFKNIFIQSCRKLETKNSCFQMVNILLRKFDISLNNKEINENDQNTKFYDEKQF